MPIYQNLTLGEESQICKPQMIVEENKEHAEKEIEIQEENDNFSDLKKAIINYL